MLIAFLLVGALAADETSPTYYCNNELRWADWPRREDKREFQLNRVAVFGRHGARVLVRDEHCWDGDETKYTCPTQTFMGYANSPSAGSSPGFRRVRGQLVDSGIEMHMNNGQQAARFYKRALGLNDTPDDDQVMIRSTEVPRVVQSAIAFMLGMFPTLNITSPSLNMIIPDSDVDPMTPRPSICPRLADELHKFYNSQAKDVVKRTQAQRDYIGELTGRSRDFSTEDPRKVKATYSALLDCLTAHFCPTVPSDDKSVPQGLEPGSALLVDILSNATFWSNGKYRTSPELMKLAYGPMIDEFLTDLRETRRRFSLYMGHDTGPANSIMDALGLRCQLVDTGIQMLLNNGEQAARLYKDELGLDDIPQDQHVMIRSTEVTRVIQSAIAFTIGMFPALNSSWPSLNMIIPDENVDPMTPKNSVCPQLEDVLNEFYASAEGKKAVSRTKAQREYIGYITGRSDDFSTEDPDDMGDLYGGLNDCLTTHFCPTVPSDDKSVPRGLEPGGTIYADVLSNVTFWWNGKYHTSKELMKRAYGPIIDDFLDDLRVPGRRFSLYMGHDTGPANSIMDSLDLTWIDSGNRCTRNLPPFGSVLVMESYSDRQVRWVFNGRVASMDAIEECKAKPTCSFDLMWKYFADLVPNTYECEPLPRHRSRLRRS
ncbi:hypothetical protein FOL47_000914 [Perkinsus chesapeaki]|uniref:Lysophosphatidic acid phosphatase type 6 n=1 Tax=Perkinsus chesapeaki TaxID=330153 RepID=A0A7J6N1B6_PERCH|nr:hypothetical protein FOL47_000914 [Perkinsus chesapeaki]